MQFPSLTSPIVYWITYSFINTVWTSILLGLCSSSLYSLWCLALFSSPVAKWLISKTNLFHISSGNFSNLSSKSTCSLFLLSQYFVQRATTRQSLLPSKKCYLWPRLSSEYQKGFWLGWRKSSGNSADGGTTLWLYLMPPNSAFKND